MANLKIWDGSSWITPKAVKRWNGSSWDIVNPKRWNGSSWEYTMAYELFYIGDNDGADIDGVDINIYDINGNIRDYFEGPMYPYVSPNGYVYYADTYGDYGIRQYNLETKTQVNGFNFADQPNISDLAVDELGNVFVCGDVEGLVACLDENLNLKWRSDNNNNFLVRNTIDVNNNAVYVIGTVEGLATAVLTKYRLSDGVKLWEYTNNTDWTGFYSVCVDIDGNIYIGVADTFDDIYALSIFDKNKNHLKEISVSDQIKRIKYNPTDDYVYFTNYNGKIYKVNRSTKSIVWESSDLGLNDLFFRNNGDLYVTGYDSNKGGYFMGQVDKSNGILMWYLNTSSGLDGIAVGEKGIYSCFPSNWT
jgi:hypothetical protein